jgi:hypothetical protein
MSDQLSLKLFHGRNSPDEVLSDWGFDGPCLGPFEFLAFTYGSLRLGTLDPEFYLQTVDDLFFYDGQFYGDAIVSADAPDTPLDQRRLDVPRALMKKRSEHPRVRVPREKLGKYREICSVFMDAIRESVGDDTADSMLIALANVVPATPLRLARTSRR